MRILALLLVASVAVVWVAPAASANMMILECVADLGENPADPSKPIGQSVTDAVDDLKDDYVQSGASTNPKDGVRAPDLGSAFYTTQDVCVQEMCVQFGDCVEACNRAWMLVGKMADDAVPEEGLDGPVTDHLPLPTEV